MRMKFVAVMSLCAVVCFALVSRAEKDADLKLLISKAGKPVVNEKFDGAKLPKGWAAKKGQFTPRDGSLAGWEKKEDQHAAVLMLDRPFKNAIIRFSFKRDGATGFNLSFNHAKGHLFRILINDDELTISKDRDKNDAASKPQVLATAEGKFPTGQWLTLLVEIVGDKVAVQADNGVKLQANHPALAVEKTGYRFVTRGSTLLLDDVTIWDVQR